MSANCDEFQALSASLDRLLEILAAGQWEAIPDQQAGLLPALEAIRNPALIRDKRLSLEQAGSLHEKLTTAIRECEERRAQIAPLLEAFGKSRSSAPNP